MEELKRTPLWDEHRNAGAKLVSFAGYDMPVQYRSGIIAEHQAVRKFAGLFDVSHMGEVLVSGPQATEFLQRVTTNDVSKLEPGRIHYSGLLYPSAGFVDDILVYCEGPNDYLVVVNASNTEKDFEWMREAAKEFDVTVDNASARFAQLALQGPVAEKVLQPLTDVPLAPMKYYRFARGKVMGHDAIVSRTGYTGEDGFEVYIDPEHAPALFRRILEAGKEHNVLPAGLGARDTLRLEAKMALYGNDIDHTTTPLQADLGWIVKLDKGDFFGSDVLKREKEEGVQRKLVGFEMVDRGIARHGYPVVRDGKEIGVVTSGTHSPTLKRAIGLAYLPSDLTAVGTEFMVLNRGKETKARVVPTPFYKRQK